MLLFSNNIFRIQQLLGIISFNVSSIRSKSAEISLSQGITPPGEIEEKEIKEAIIEINEMLYPKIFKDVKEYYED